MLSVKQPADRPSVYLMYLPAFALLGLVVLAQRRRQGPSAESAPQAV